MDGPLLVCNMFSFVFWKKLKTPKRHFEIIWHLVVANSCRICWNLDLKNSTSVFLYCWRLLFVQCWYNKTCLEATLAPALLWYCISPSQFFFPSITLFGVYTLLTPVGNLSFKILHKTAQNRNSKHHVVAGKKTHKEENIYNNKHKTF